MALGKGKHLLRCHHVARGIVRVTQPAQGAILAFLITKHTASVLIFPERGLQNVASALVAIGLGNQVNGIHRTARHHHLVGADATVAGNHPLERSSRGFGIGADGGHAGTQVGIQRTQVSPVVNVGTEVHLDVVVAV